MWSGYRPSAVPRIARAQASTQLDVTIVLIGRDRLSPGESCPVKLFFHRPDLWPDLCEGDDVSLFEGATWIADVRIGSSMEDRAA